MPRGGWRINWNLLRLLIIVALHMGLEVSASEAREHLFFDQVMALGESSVELPIRLAATRILKRWVADERERSGATRPAKRSRAADSVA